MSTVDDVRRQMERQFDFIMALWDCPKPFITRCTASAGPVRSKVALACDITIAAEDIRFGKPKFGTGIVAMLLPWAVLPRHAEEMLLTGSHEIDASRAHAIGFVNHVVPADELVPLGQRIALDIAAAAGPSESFIT